MDRTITQIIHTLEPQLRAEGATSLYVFGSRARGDFDDMSDLDVFVDYAPNSKFSLFNVVRLERMIQQATGVKTDLTTRDSLNKMLREEIEAQAVKLF